MKIHIVKPNEPSIQGYERVDNLDLSRFSDNECDFIHAGDLIDNVPLDQVAQVLKLLYSKLRMGGTLLVGGTDLRMFCKAVLNNEVKEYDASNMLGSKASMSNPEYIREALTGMGLNVQSSHFAGIHYEVIANR